MQIFVVGGGYAAAEEADYLSRFGKHVTVLVRGDHFTCPPLTAARALNNPKVSVEYNTEVKEVAGDDYLTSATLVNNKTGKETVYHVDEGDNTFGMFIYIGTQPATQNLSGIVELDSNGYIKTDDEGATNVPGVYAAGDVIVKPLRPLRQRLLKPMLLRRNRSRGSQSMRQLPRSLLRRLVRQPSWITRKRLRRTRATG